MNFFSATTARPPTADEHRRVLSLADRLGPHHLATRLRREAAVESKALSLWTKHLETDVWYGQAAILTACLKAIGLYWRGRRNADAVQLRHNPIELPHLPAAFDGFRILHLSDLHVENSGGALHAVKQLLADMPPYDVYVLTGDYRAKSIGPRDAAVAAMRDLRGHVAAPTFGVLGNHDATAMIAGLEAAGIRLLLNETATITRGGARLHLAGIDDAHYFHTHDLAKVAPAADADVAVLLSHTPEIYREAAHRRRGGSHPAGRTARCGPWPRRA